MAYDDAVFPIGDKPGLNGPPDPTDCDECGAAGGDCDCYSRLPDELAEEDES